MLVTSYSALSLAAFRSCLLASSVVGVIALSYILVISLTTGASSVLFLLSVSKLSSSSSVILSKKSRRPSIFHNSCMAEFNQQVDPLFIRGQDSGAFNNGVETGFNSGSSLFPSHGPCFGSDSDDPCCCLACGLLAKAGWFSVGRLISLLALPGHSF